MKNKFGLLESDLEIIIQTLSRHPKVERAYLFGSRAKGNFKEGSDVDIALKGTGPNLKIQSQIKNSENLINFAPPEPDSRINSRIVLNY